MELIAKLIMSNSPQYEKDAVWQNVIRSNYLPKHLRDRSIDVGYCPSKELLIDMSAYNWVPIFENTGIDPIENFFDSALEQIGKLCFEYYTEKGDFYQELKRLNDFMSKSKSIVAAKSRTIMPYEDAIEIIGRNDVFNFTNPDLKPIIKPNSINIIAGRPENGKTSFCLAVILDLLIKNPKMKIAIGVTEINMHDMIAKLVCYDHRIDINSLSEMTISDFQVLLEITKSKYPNLRFFKARTEVDIINNANCDLCFVDSVYLVSANGQNNFNRQNALTDIMTKISNTNGTFLFSTQTKRESNPDEPELSDIAFSDSIGQVATMAWVITKGPVTSKITNVKCRYSDKPLVTDYELNHKQFEFKTYPRKWEIKFKEETNGNND